MKASTLHRAVRNGDAARVRELLGGSRTRSVDVDAYDRQGRTPLILAVQSDDVPVEIVHALLEHGADVHRESQEQHEHHRAPISRALAGGDPHKVAALVAAGADIHYRTAEGYDALIDAVHGRDVFKDARLLDLLRMLISCGVPLNGASKYCESGLRVLSRIGRFDAVQLLLDAGADADHLEWTPLMRAVALGTLADTMAEARRAPSLEDKDWWERTPWLLAIATGDVAKAELLCRLGADVDARGRCGKPPLFHAIEGYHVAMLPWLIGNGQDVEQVDQFNCTPLMTAVQYGNPQAIETLIQHGADVHRERTRQTALSDAQSIDTALPLLDAGADPSHITFEARRAFLGFDPEPDEDELLDVSPDQFVQGRTRRFGNRNPERIDEPFWTAMIRAGVNAYQATKMFDGPSSCGNPPVWCAQRFGQSITFLPDGRIVQVAGEHEDSYDADFCIYNDVFVHGPDGTFCIYGYPESEFPPTDFHTATLVDDSIYVVGSLGYFGTRRFGDTPVYRLDTRTFHVERLECRGEAPGWIYKHRAACQTAHEIRVAGGLIVTAGEPKEVHTPNPRAFVLDTRTLVWRAT